MLENPPTRINNRFLQGFPAFQDFCWRNQKDSAGSAVEIAARIPQRAILIDGARLTRLMIEHGVGVRSSRVLEFKRRDEDFFSEAQ